MSVLRKSDSKVRRNWSVASLTDGQLASVLFVFFAIFYLLQTSATTSNADATVYALRSLARFPIFDYAFLADNDPPFRQVRPNYHLGHTLILWLVYQIVPESLAHSTLPGSVVSALGGTCIVAVSFLIFRELKFDKTTAFASAITAGLIPTIWYQSTIGEIYALQLAIILLFVYFFLRQKLWLAATAFLVAVLISPLSGVAFSLLLLAPWTLRNLIRATIIGCGCLIVYLTLFHFADSNIFALFDAVNAGAPNKSVFWNGGKMLLVLLININFLILFFIVGSRIAWGKHRRTVIALTLAMIPHICLIFISTEFMRERGCFLLALLWCLSIPIGIGIVSLSKRFTVRYLPLALNCVLVITLWTIPSVQSGMAQRDAGLWLRHNATPQTRLLGDWDNGVGITVARYGWSEHILATRFFEARNATTEDVQKTGENSLIVTMRKKSTLRKTLAIIPLPWFSLKTYHPEYSIAHGELTQIYENSKLVLFQWDK